jgi:archaetidylinositol phosphate synthase
MGIQDEDLLITAKREPLIVRNLNGNETPLRSVIGPWQHKMVAYWLPRIPAWIETYHLTLATLPMSLLVILAGYLARDSLWWFWLFAVLVLCQYITDTFDGALGRFRKTGLVLWGFYMDHLMDYIFGCALVAAYTIAFRLPIEFFIIASLVMSGIFVHEFLLCAMKGKLNVSGYLGYGPTEFRLTLVIINMILPFFSRELVSDMLIGIVPFSSLILVWLVYSAQRRLWLTDMKHKQL